MKKILSIAVLVIAGCQLASAQSTSPSHDDRKALRVEKAAEYARLDSLAAQGAIAKGQTKRQVMSVYGKPELKSSLYAGVGLNFLTMYVYPERMEILYFLNGRLRGIRQVKSI